MTTEEIIDIIKEEHETIRDYSSSKDMEALNRAGNYKERCGEKRCDKDSFIVGTTWGETYTCNRILN